jgi:hypothetical protein
MRVSVGGCEIWRILPTSAFVDTSLMRNVATKQSRGAAQVAALVARSLRRARCGGARLWLPWRSGPYAWSTVYIGFSVRSGCWHYGQLASLEAKNTTKLAMSAASPQRR